VRGRRLPPSNPERPRTRLDPDSRSQTLVQYPSTSASLPHHSDAAEREIRADLSAGNRSGAVSNTLAVYGCEVFGFVTAAVAEQQSGHDAYARFVETLFHELPRFAWRCQLRTFVYFLACWQLRTMRPGPAIVAISVETRRTLPASQHPAPRSVVAAVRRSLAPEDRELLVLRFDRGFNWREIALTSMKNHSNRKAWSVVLAVALASGVAACAVPADDSAGATEPGGADQTAAQ
jgi:hypothetical protein